MAATAAQQVTPAVQTANASSHAATSTNLVTRMQTAVTAISVSQEPARLQRHALRPNSHAALHVATKAMSVVTTASAELHVGSYSKTAGMVDVHGAIREAAELMTIVAAETASILLELKMARVFATKGIRY